jgi:hypothetical protein
MPTRERGIEVIVEAWRLKGSISSCFIPDQHLSYPHLWRSRACFCHAKDYPNNWPYTFRADLRPRWRTRPGSNRLLVLGSARGFRARVSHFRQTWTICKSKVTAALDSCVYNVSSARNSAASSPSSSTPCTPSRGSRPRQSRQPRPKTHVATFRGRHGASLCAYSSSTSYRCSS